MTFNSTISSQSKQTTAHRIYNALVKEYQLFKNLTSKELSMIADGWFSPFAQDSKLHESIEYKDMSVLEFDKHGRFFSHKKDSESPVVESFLL